MPTDPRFLASSTPEIFTGNELLIKGCLEVEGGVHLLTGYPGSPVAGFFDILGDIKDLLNKNGVRASQANNEALSVAAVNGAQMGGLRALAVFKSVGVHVASDALALGTLAGAHPDAGAVIIMGDDPWCDSTQVPADSRFICEHLRMAVVEPGDAQQVKDWIDASFKLSRAAGVYIGYIITTAQADGGGTVLCRPNQFPEVNTHQRMTLDTSKIDLDKVLLPPRTWQHELAVPERFAKTLAAARELGVNRIIPAAQGSSHAAGAAPLGFIVTGMGGPYLQHVLADLGLSGEFPILQMGMSYPVDVAMVQEFSHLCRDMVVIEERRSFLEKNIRDALFHAAGAAGGGGASIPHADAAELSSRLYGKSFPHQLDGIPETRGLNPSLLARILIPLIKATEEIPAELRNGRLSAEMDIIKRASKLKLNVVSSPIVSRTPTFCPGCPHRDSSAVLLEIRQNLADPKYMSRVHRHEPVDLVAHGDTGCYTMLMFAPTQQLMHNYSGMGLGAGTGAGIDPFITNKQIVFMGDGTFFHSGQVAISNAIKAGQDITFIILENKTTAMTGHQEHAGTEVDVVGNRSYLQDIDQIVRGMAGTSPLTVEKLSPADRDQYKKVLERTILRTGVKVLIADKECGITYHRTQLRNERKVIKEKGYLPSKKHMNITPEVCEDCRECTKQTACPGLVPVDTDYGKKIDTDLTWCVNDGACERVRTSNDYGDSVKPCPSFEEVTILRKKRRRYTLPNMGLDKLPDPPLHPMARGQAWRVHMAGVGGMGIGVVTAILVRAGHKQGHRVVFADKKGLAIRNGGVYSQITYVNDRAPEDAPETALVEPRDFYPTTGVIPFGKADLLLGIDILEAARATDPRENFRIASPSKTKAVLNLHKQATVYALLDKEDFDVDALRQLIDEHCNAASTFAKDLSGLCEKRLGSKQYANIMMLGVAYQLGHLPVSAHSIAWAIRDTIRKGHKENLKAFNIGRKLALEPRALPNRPEPATWEQLLTNKLRVIHKSRVFWRGFSERFEKLVRGAVAAMPALPEQAKYDLALRIYDLMQYQGHNFAGRYVDLVRGVYARDRAAKGHAATLAAIWGAAKVMLIKDEPYVAYLLTRYEKKQRDIAKYNVDLANGDRIIYRHNTSPEFNIGKMRFRFKIRTRDWQLNLVRRMKWWRKLPGWHRREVQFREWYIALLSQVSLDTDARYDQALKVLGAPADVKGYREVRYPKMDEAKKIVDQALARPTVEVSVNSSAIAALMDRAESRAEESSVL